MTWLEMIKYLKDQENCRIDGKGFFVLDLYQFIDKVEAIIKCYPPEKRSINKSCLNVKNSLVKVYHAHRKGLVSELGTMKKNEFSIFLK